MRLASYLAIVFVLVQIVLGGAVRLTGSGLSCPDWPLCHGFWLPTVQALETVPDLAYEHWQVWLEWIHRVNAAVFVAPLVLLVLLTAQTPKHRLLGGAAVVLVVTEAFLGAFTVFDRNSPWSVTVHLVIALILLVALVGSSTGPRRARVHSRILPPDCKQLAWLGTAVAIATAGAGAFLAKSGAAHACPDWLLCGSPWNQAHYANPDVLLHIVHRLLALATVIPALVLLARLPRRQAPVAFSWAAATPVVFVLQALLGLVTAMSEPELWIALSHQLVGALLVVSYAMVGWYVFRER
ncbi:MAG: COX15/CtaA family protein [Rhodospirillales bacterium]|nr:COX15/CtaA family protein [Rhodospirillales bacterium]MYE19944.1 heme A synthase [Rhodospirillales bacterium]